MGGKQVPRFARNDRKKSKGKCNYVSRFLASTPTGKERLSGTPAALGMTERKARATANTAADPCGMTTRRATTATKAEGRGGLG